MFCVKGGGLNEWDHYKRAENETTHRDHLFQQRGRSLPKSHYRLGNNGWEG